MEELLNQVPCGFLIFADDGKIVEANITLLKMLGYEREELLSLPVEKIFSIAGRIFFQTHFTPLLKLKNLVTEVYLTLRTKNGEDTPVMVNAARNERGGKIYNDCVFLEMKQRDQYENEIRQAKKLAEAATLAKDEFLQTVSHELRTPLNSILGWSKIIADGTLDAETIKRASEIITRSAKAQGQLIEDILDYTRINSGQLRLEIIQVDLAKTVKDAIEIITPAAVAKNLTLEIELDPNALISGDASRLQQAFWNLLLNAVKFTPKDGRILVKLKRINSHVEISIADNGKGISSEFLPYVFDRLQQEDSSETRRQGGLGLGLSITRQIVELHGGTIRAESPGKDLGATFTISLQVRVIGEKFTNQIVDRDLAAPAPTLIDAPRLDGTNVLVVDDNPDARKLLVGLLSTQGAKVIPAANVAAAVRLYETEKFDLVISDISMPGEDGFSLIKKLNAYNQKQKRIIPAIALTAQSSAAERIKILTAGFQIYLLKPIEPAELITITANLTRLIK